jgi:hypothetical protein
MKVKEIITEAPYLHPEELPYKALSAISVDRLGLSYSKIGEIDDGGGLEVYQHKSNKGIAAGKILEKEFYFAVSITTRETIYPAEPTQLDEMLQVAMVNVSKGQEENGITKKVYEIAAQAINLVSDHEQYLGAKGLWKSLARSSDVNVYVFDGNVKDYIRGVDGKIVKYNGRNISDHDIWGQTIQYKSVLLVATTRGLK